MEDSVQNGDVGQGIVQPAPLGVSYLEFRLFVRAEESAEQRKDEDRLLPFKPVRLSKTTPTLG